MGKEEARGSNSKGVRREKIKGGEEVREFIVRKANERKKIFFPKPEEDNIYRSYALCEREIVLLKKKFGKQSIEN